MANNKKHYPQHGKKDTDFSLSPKNITDMVKTFSKVGADAVEAYKNHMLMEQEREKTRQKQEETRQAEMKHQVELARIDAENRSQTQKNYIEMLKNEWAFLNSKQQNLITFSEQWRKILETNPGEPVRSRILDNLEELQRELINTGTHMSHPKVMHYIESVRRDLDV